jgi:hypothetical protein
MQSRDVNDREVAELRAELKPYERPTFLVLDMVSTENGSQGGNDGGVFPLNDASVPP